MSEFGWLVGLSGTSAWSWAYQHLLPSASKNTVYNLWRYREQRPDPDPQRNATAATIDYAVQQKAVRHCKCINLQYMFGDWLVDVSLV
jgi:hypothetical protein